MGTEGNDNDDLKRDGTNGEYTQEDINAEDKNDGEFNGGRGDEEVEENMRS